MLFDRLPCYFPAPMGRIPKAFLEPWNPALCSDDPPAPAPPGGGPPVDPPATPPTPPRAVNQSAEDRVAQLEDINANLRVEAATRRVSERTVKDQLANNERELATLRTQLQAAQTEGEAKANTAITRMKTRTVDAELKAQAATAGIVDLDLLPLVDRAGVTCDDDGNVTGAKEAIEAFKTKKPEYFRAAAAPGSRPAEVPAVRSGGPAPAPPPPGAAPPPGASVREIPRTREGQQDYAAKKKAALASLRG